eukprot:GHVU01159605.1.p1 GENE.GHVU01159605.1~~GHVU01159605.1.p1  ORF type:complete len:391 (+),score=10.90 GHVU01159605.1:1298-2470(+)
MVNKTMYLLTRHIAKNLRSSGSNNSKSVSPGSSPRLQRKFYSVDQDLLCCGNSGNVSDEYVPELDMPRNANVRRLSLKNSQVCQSMDSALQVPDIVISDHSGSTREPLQCITPRLVHTIDPRTKFDEYCSVPTGVAFTTNDDLVVSDSSNGKVKIFDLSGGLKVECYVTKNYGCMADPRGVAVLPGGEIIACDCGERNIKVFTPEGRFLTKFGKNLHKPEMIAVNKEGHTLVADTGQKKIISYKKLSSRNSVNLGEETYGELPVLHPSGLTVLDDGTITVSDQDKNFIYCLDRNGRHLSTFPMDSDLQGDISARLNAPRGLARDLDGSVLIADSRNNRVIRWNPKTSFFNVVIDASAGLVNPFEIGTSSHGCIAVLESDSSNVKVFQYME